ncbi:MAG: tetratricopeptide repeat protein [Sphingomonadales bacterium]
MIRLMFVAALLLSFARPGWADWQAGQDAADRGNFQTAINEWRTAAETGDARSQFSLGLAYQLGDGVGRDFVAAQKYYLMAAQQGHAGAQVALGNLCLMGLGMEKDKVLAYMWFSIAATADHGMATRKLEKMAGYMSAEEIAQAQLLEQSWRETHK